MDVRQLSRLIPTHNVLRDVSTIFNICQEGYQFRPQDPRIKVFRLQGEEGLYIHDGHHRIIAAVLEDIEIPDDMIDFVDSSVADYLAVNPERGWYTPFDPRHECRVPDFREFKNEARGRTPGPDLERWVRANRDRYIEPRRILSISELLAISISIPQVG